MSDLRDFENAADAADSIVTDSGSDGAGIENGHGVNITGRVVQSGSNPDGSYVRYADGTQICWHSYSTNDVPVTSSAAGGFRSGGGAVDDWTFPKPFIDDTRRVFGSMDNQNALFMGQGFGSQNTATTYGPIVWRPTSATVNISISVMAVGRWK